MNGSSLRQFLLLAALPPWCETWTESMPQIRRLRKRKPRATVQSTISRTTSPAIDAAVAVKARLGSFLARWTVYAVCVFLAALVMLVFGQVGDHKFIDLGDKTTVYRNPLVTSVLKTGPILHVFRHTKVDYDAGGFYSPLDDGLPTWLSGRSATSWMTGPRATTPPREHGAAWSHDHPSFPGIAPGYRRHLAQRFCRGAVCHPSAAGGISVVGRPARRFAVRSFLRPPRLALTSAMFTGHGRCGATGWYCALFILPGLFSQPAMGAPFPLVLLLLDYWPLGLATRSPVFANATGPGRQDFSPRSFCGW